MNLTGEQVQDICRSVNAAVVKFCGKFDEDLFQEAWVAVMMALPRFDPSRNVPLGAYVAWRAKGALYDHHRQKTGRVDRGHRRKPTETPVPWGDLATEPPTSDDLPEDIVERRELVRRILRRVPEEDRKVLALYAIGVPSGEIGKEVGIHPTMVPYVVHRAEKLANLRF